MPALLRGPGQMYYQASEDSRTLAYHLARVRMSSLGVTGNVVYNHVRYGCAVGTR